MEEELRTIQLWAGHGTPRQFYHEVMARLSGEGYDVEMIGDESVIVSKSRKTGGFLGIGGRKSKEIMLQIDFSGGEVIIPEGGANAEFVSSFAKKLSDH